jgi:stage II sporulation protein E
MLNKPLEHRKKALIQYLRRQGISVREIVFMEGDEKNISIEARVNGRTSISAQALGELLSSFMGRKLVLSAESARLIGRTYDIYIYGDESKYMILSAVSRAVKENEKISGDNFSIEEYNHGQTVVMLADGMGSGEKACGDSRTLIEFMEKFLEAGFDRGRAFSMASAAISALEGSFGLTTLDMCTLDLMAGEADFIKAGAAPSYIKRGRGVNRIDSDTLPLGGTRSVTPILQTVRLFEDDMVVMVSDGIVEAVEGDGIMTVEEFLSRSDACIPNELSDKLLHYAISCQKGHIPDDMTVVVCRIKKKP